MAPPIRSIKGVLPLLVAVCLVFTTFPFQNSIASKNHIVDREYYLNSGPETTVPFLSTDDGDNKTEALSVTTQRQNEEKSDTHDELKRFFELTPKTDNSPNPNEVEEIQRRNPNLPIAFWNDKKNKNMHYKNESCAEFPSIFDLNFNNQHWQTLHTSNGTFRLYGAYYETRELSKFKPIVRILGVLNRIEPTVKTYCQLWFPSLNEPVFGEVLEYQFLWYKLWGRYQQGLYQPYLISCKIPSTFQNDIPAAVSLVEKPCDMASNILRVNYNKLDKKKDFVVCVKGLDFPYSDLSVRLVEWIEVVRTLGADKIVFYEFNIHPNASKVLKYYEKLGFVQTVHHTLPAGKPNLPGLQHMYLANREIIKNQLEIIPYNDCFYKNMYAYRYVVLLDIDEVIVPAKVSTWKELMDIVEAKAFAEKKEPRDVFSARNVYFFDNYPEKLGWFEDIPRYMYMLQHAYRTVYFTPPFFYVKSFFNTDRALSLNHHYTFTCLKSCDMYEIPIPDAKLHHFRGDCAPELQGVCNELRKNVVVDKAIWNIKDKVIEGTIDTLKKLGFFTWNVTFSGKYK